VEKVLGTKKTGTSYLKVTFADETGSIQGFMWDHAKRYQNIVEEYEVTGAIAIVSKLGVVQLKLDLQPSFQSVELGLNMKDRNTITPIQNIAKIEVDTIISNFIQFVHFLTLNISSLIDPFAFLLFFK